MDFNSNITIVRGNNNKSDIIINHRDSGNFQRVDIRCPDTADGGERQGWHVSCEYINISMATNDVHSTNVQMSLKEQSGIQMIFKGLCLSQEEKSKGTGEQEGRTSPVSHCGNLITDNSEASVYYKMEEQSVILRNTPINKQERSKRCASVGPLMRERPDGRRSHMTAKSRVSMYELASDGWIYGVGNNHGTSTSTSTKVLDLDEEINNIIKSDSCAVVTLGNLKLVF